MNNYDQSNPPACHENCWHYGVFGGVEGCEAKNELEGNPWPEPIEPGQKCLYPDKRDVKKPLFIGSMVGLCAALEGEVIIGGPADNTQLVQLLVGSEVKK